MSLQRLLQKGRYAFFGLKSASLPHCGHGTVRALNWVASADDIVMVITVLLCAQSELKVDVLWFTDEVSVFVLLHHAYGHNQAVGANFRYGVVHGIHL